MADSDPVWRGEAPKLPALTEQLSADLCVIGLGASGLSAIREARRLGLSVIGLDARAVAAGAAGRNGGLLLAGMVDFYDVLVANHGRDIARELYTHTRSELTRAAADAPHTVQLGGSLRLAASAEERPSAQAHLAALQADGLPGEWRDTPDGEGVFIPGDGVFQPWARAQRLAQLALDAGAQLYARSPVQAITPGEVRTPQGAVRSQFTLVAVDGRIEALLPQLHGRVRTARLQMLATEPGAVPARTYGTYARFGMDYWQHLPDGRLALGGGRDIEGDAAFTHQESPSANVQTYLERLLRERHASKARITHRWAGLVAYTEDRLPLCEQLAPHLIAIGAYCGTGNLVGPLCGRAAVRRFANQPAPFADLLDRARGHHPSA